MLSLKLAKLPVRRNRWFERLIAIIAVVNLGLVLFDLTYVPWRDLYFQELPKLTQLYDPIKGIQPHRETQNYLTQIEELQRQISSTGLQSPQVENLLEKLRSLSNEMIQDNPFAVANKSGSLEKIKNQMRNRTNRASAHQAFNLFWSYDYLSQTGWQQEIKFFNTHIKPIIQTNYYRKIWINGKSIDNFWQLDLPFSILFLLEFVAYSYYLYRTRAGLTRLEAILRHWYDIFLLLPFWRWLRVITVIIRLYQADLLNLEPVKAQIKHDFAANFAEELTEVVGIRIINQAQEAIRRGDVARWLFQPNQRPYLNINNTNEVQAIASRLVHLSVYQVLPKIKPDLEALLRYNIESILKQSAIYQQLQSIPAMGHLPSQLTEKLVTDISQTAYSTLTTAIEDPVVTELSNRLVQNFSQTLKMEVQKEHNLQEIQSLLVELLEEIKINYVKGIAEAGLEETLEEAVQLHQIIHR